MKKKLLFISILLLSMITCGICTVNAEATEDYLGEEIEVEGHDLKFVPESVKIKVYQMNSNKMISANSKTLVGTIDYEVTNTNWPSFIHGLNAENLTDNSVYIDLNLDITKTKMTEIINTFLAENTTYEDKNLLFDVVLNYKWTKLPTYINYYKTNYIEDSIKTSRNQLLSEENEIDNVTLNTSTSQVINTAKYYQEESEGGTTTTKIEYETEINKDSNLDGMYNYLVFTNNIYTIDDCAQMFTKDGLDITFYDEDDTKILFHDVDEDSIEYMVNARKKQYEEVGDEEEQQQVVVPNTGIPTPTLLLGIALFLILTGGAMVGIFLKQKRQTQE